MNWFIPVGILVIIILTILSNRTIKKTTELKQAKLVLQELRVVYQRALNSGSDLKAALSLVTLHVYQLRQDKLIHTAVIDLAVNQFAMDLMTFGRITKE